MKVRCLLIGVVVLFVAGILTASSYAKVDPKTCVGMWLFDEGKGDVASDSSRNGLDGQILGGAEYVDGKFGKALKYNGSNQCVEVEHDDIMNITDEPFTMLCWFYWEGAGDGWQTFFSKGPMSVLAPAGTNENWALFVNTGSGYFHFIITPNGARTNVDSPGGVIKVKEWQFVAGTYDGTKIKIYLDGEMIKEQALTGELTPNTSNLRLGHREESPHWWMGMQDEMAVFKKALSEDEINDIMRNGLLKFAAVESRDKLPAVWGGIKAR